MRYLFVDESGDHSLHKIDPQFPMFALAGCFFEQSYYHSTVVPLVQNCKQQLFGNSEIIFHTADISRNKNGFEQIKELEFRQRFYQSVNQMVSDLDFMLIVVALDKFKHKEQYSNPSGPYDYCFECLLERCVMHLDEVDDTCEIIAESRNDQFDRELKETFNKLRHSGSSHMHPQRFMRRITGIRFAKKAANDPGLQIADLSVTPIARHVLGRKKHEDVEILLRKLRRNGQGDYRGYGLKILP